MGKRKQQRGLTADEKDGGAESSFRPGESGLLWRDSQLQAFSVRVNGSKMEGSRAAVQDTASFLI